MKKQFKNVPKKISILKALILFTALAIPSMAGSQTLDSEDMVLINAGGFVRGVDQITSKNPTASGVAKTHALAQPFSDESPARMIYLDSYYLDIYEISNAQYTEFIIATDYAAPAYWDHHELNQPDQPVTGVNWYDASAYCHWANKRLPTEAEWEKAARGPAGSIYPWGNDLQYENANFARGEKGDHKITTPIKAYDKGKSYYGVFNMAGNVFEWVNDWYDPNYYKRRDDVKNPKGPQIDLKAQASAKKVIRGGSWYAPAQSITTTHRFWNNPTNNSYGVGLGFRCARNAEASPANQARSFYMDALIHMGAEKFKEAEASIKQAIELDSQNAEYRKTLELIKKQS
ncbi:MAG: formylglycine-generating enzyme family protein [Candidatus Nitrohelix vancouverensis]|uniref:Formylglycine-generating enzyme family protein n=1 Tax=Candidatus Nitrohelix vancouverensis TaxID=2705534 RepID=A0A7T0G3U4_9BACT|nr:MAG: formylglycine-generating enzyme family protein [Candidatus Nitrohelix vancouverensis]